MRDRAKEYAEGRLDTTSGAPPKTFDMSVPDPNKDPDGQHRSYWVLSDAERAKGFVRPVRNSYKHLTCGGVTTMGRKLAETYAVSPAFYGETFCGRCGGHFPVGATGEFVWEGTDEMVGT